MKAIAAVGKGEALRAPLLRNFCPPGRVRDEGVKKMKVSGADVGQTECPARFQISWHA